MQNEQFSSVKKNTHLSVFFLFRFHLNFEIIARIEDCNNWSIGSIVKSYPIIEGERERETQPHRLLLWAIVDLIDQMTIKVKTNSSIIVKQCSSSLIYISSKFLTSWTNLRISIESEKRSQSILMNIANSGMFKVNQYSELVIPFEMFVRGEFSSS